MATKQLRIVTLGDYQKWFSYFLMGTAQGSFLNGHLHYSIPIRQNPVEIRNQLNYFKPHVLFCHMIFSENLYDYLTGKREEREMFHEELVKIRSKWGTKIVYQEGDARRKPRYPYPVTELVDLILVNAKTHGDFEILMKVPAVHWPYFALNQEKLKSPMDIFKHDMVFTGNVTPRNKKHLHYKRSEFLEKIRKKGLPIKIYPDDQIGNTRFCSGEISMSASGILGINQGMDVPGYLDTRPWQYIGSGGLFFMDPSSAMDLFFEPDVHYVPYERHNVDDLIDKYQEMMKHPEKNKSIRLEGFRYVQAHHTAKHRVQMVLDILAGKEISPIYLEDIRSKNKIEEDNNANV